MTAHAFTYGSLMWADIMARVCGHEFASEPASLAGYTRHPVQGQDYPGLRAAPGGLVPGRLYRDVDAASWARLDAFEGDEYERIGVTVVAADGSRVPARVYLFRDAYLHRLAAGEWDADAFGREGHARFTARYAGFDVLAGHR